VAFKSLCSHMWSGQYKDPIQAKSLMQALRNDRRSASLFNHRQQDAHECLCVLLDALHQDTNGALQSDRADSSRARQKAEAGGERDPSCSAHQPSSLACPAATRDSILGDTEWVDVEDAFLVDVIDVVNAGSLSPGGRASDGDRPEHSRRQSGSGSPDSAHVTDLHSVVSKFVACYSACALRAASVTHMPSMPSLFAAKASCAPSVSCASHACALSAAHAR
jgi:hypothetical protein